MKENTIVLKPLHPKNFDPKFGGQPESFDVNSVEDYYQPFISNAMYFAVGKYFWYIADMINGQILSAGGLYNLIDGFKPEDCYPKKAEELFLRIHPEDLPYMFAYGKYLSDLYTRISQKEILKLKPVFYTRILNSDKNYNWVMLQIINPIVDKNGTGIFSLAFITDISHIKTDHICFMSIVDTENNSCSHFVCNSAEHLIRREFTFPKISGRELEILKFLSAGYLSKQIAGELNISVKTVNNHRQNLLRKMKASSTAELISICIKAGLL